MHCCPDVHPLYSWILGETELGSAGVQPNVKDQWAVRRLASRLPRLLRLHYIRLFVGRALFGVDSIHGLVLIAHLRGVKFLGRDANIR